MLPTVLSKILICLVILNTSFLNLLLLVVGLFDLLSHLQGFFLLLVSSLLLRDSFLDLFDFILCKSTAFLNINHSLVPAVLWKLKGSMAKQMLKKSMSVRSSLRANVAYVLVVYLGNTVFSCLTFVLVMVTKMLWRYPSTAGSALSLIMILLPIHSLG